LRFRESGGVLVKVLGVSGSPIENGNTDRLVKAVLKGIGGENRFLKLSEVRIGPCNACLGCVQTNLCVQEDDWGRVSKWVREAQVLVVGGYTPYNSLDARTKAFLERCFSLRHRRGLNRGKYGVAVVTGLDPDGIEKSVEAIAHVMEKEGMEVLGRIATTGNPPCIRCGHGNECPMSAIRMMLGPEGTVADWEVRRVEDDREALSEARKIGSRIRELLGEG
jgi:multimeric flavodoxin WrbA